MYKNLTIKRLTDTGDGITTRCERTIIMPAFNEEERIKPTLQSYLEYFNGDTEVMVVLNGCRDNTADVVCSLMNDHANLRVLEVVDRIGKGGALILGFYRARGEIIAYVDADGSTAPEDLDKLMSSIDDNDCIAGSRWIDRSKMVVRQSLLRQFASRVFNLIVRILFRLPVRDTLCGAKAFKREAVQAIVQELGTTNVAVDVDVLYLLHNKGFTIREFPLAWEDKPGSKFKLRRDAPLALGALIRMRIKHSRLKNLVE